ncbi:hypothetical protein Desti_1472 [Desulfomonile tiedjei DSM 6799]|uniref:Uncharacterized protein n=1 Tax=Desulfomonile tiedjei (strain ATCC 49306 / DSM 6799 / DCB-1) TaxID=706587 RepID=I4C3P3_DESTA|nr:hypothetical protein Desti_1472 [Desulfomonile tiedjei DSM 6799]
MDNCGRLLFGLDNRANIFCRIFRDNVTEPVVRAIITIAVAKINVRLRIGVLVGAGLRAGTSSI